METDRPILGQNSLTSIASEVSLWENLINWSGAGAHAKNHHKKSIYSFYLTMFIQSVIISRSKKKRRWSRL